MDPFPGGFRVGDATASGGRRGVHLVDVHRERVQLVGGRRGRPQVAQLGPGQGGPQAVRLPRRLGWGGGAVGGPHSAL